MTPLKLWNPWRQMARREPFGRFGVLEDFDTLFPQWPAMQDMRVDIDDNGGAYVLTAELPGVAKDDIEVSIDGNYVAIAAELKRDRDAKDERRVCNERYYGQVQRAFTLDSAVDAGRAEAKFEGGVLRLTLPKKAGPEARRLAIS